MGCGTNEDTASGMRDTEFGKKEVRISREVEGVEG